MNKNYYLDPTELTNEVVKCQDNNNKRSPKLDKFIIEMAKGFVRTYRYVDDDDKYDAEGYIKEELLKTWWKYNAHVIVHLKNHRFYARLRDEKMDLLVIDRKTHKHEYYKDFERNFEKVMRKINSIEKISERKFYMAKDRWKKIPPKSKFNNAFPIWTTSANNGAISYYRIKNKIKTISYDNVFEDSL